MSLAGKEILVIDDDQDILKMLIKIFEGVGMTVYATTSVAEAIDLMQLRAPHMITLDINLTGETGFDFLRQKNKLQAFAHIPVVIISTESNRRYVAKALSMGAVDYIVKPIIAHKIILKTRKVLKDFKSPIQEFCFPIENAPTMTLQCKGDIVKLNEISCVLKSPVKMGKNVDPQVKSKLLDDLGISACKLRSVNEGKTVAPGIYTTELTYVGMDDRIASRIRRFQKYKAKKI